MARDLNGAWLAIGVAGAVAAAGVAMGGKGSRAKSPPKLGELSSAVDKANRKNLIKMGMEDGHAAAEWAMENEPTNAYNDMAYGAEARLNSTSHFTLSPEYMKAAKKGIRKAMWDYGYRI